MLRTHTNDVGEAPAAQSLDDAVVRALRRILRATDVHSRRLLRDFGITGPQLLTLRALSDGRDQSTTTLARALSVSLPTASDVVRRLESRGLVERSRGDEDRREMRVSITQAGVETLSAAPPSLHESLRSRLANLEEWERTQILSVLQRVVGMMEGGEAAAGAESSGREGAPAVAGSVNL